MAKQVLSYKRFQGISDFDKETFLQDGCSWCRSVDFRTNPNQVTLLPKTSKESGSVVTDLPKWAVTTPTNLDVYAYGNTGNLYKRTTAGSWSFLRQAASSHGNGLAYYAEDDYLYYTCDSVIGRYGPLGGTPTASDDYLGAQGGVPTNTYSLDLEAGSSQYGSKADTASLSITGDLTLEAYIKPETLPTAGTTMTLVGKWDESGTTRSYIMDINAVSGYFGDGSDGALTISSNTTEAPIDSACTGTSGTNSLTATNASFASGQIVLIHQSQGTGAGTWERNKIAGYTAGTITLENNLAASYTSGAQVRVLKQYTNVTINSGITYTAKAWNGTVGGIIGWVASGTVTVNGTISASGGNGSATNTDGAGGGTGGGFRGGGAGRETGGDNKEITSYSGEGTTGASAKETTTNGNGASGAYNGDSYGPHFSGSGGGNADSGSAGGYSLPGSNWVASSPGTASGNASLTTMTFGGGGAGGVSPNANTDQTFGAGGGSGGGIIFIIATTITMESTGHIYANGGEGASGVDCAGGSGAGGSILLKCQTATLGTTLVTATGGATVSNAYGNGGAGSTGRIHIDYYTSYTGTTSPTIDYAQDNTLVTTVAYYLRLGVSSDGDAEEFLSKEVAISTGTWYRTSISWDASESTAEFYLNGESQGTRVGAVTAIHNNASALTVGGNNSGSAVANFFDGKIDDVRIWSLIRSDGDILAYNDVELLGTEGSLQAYYKLNNAATDLTSNANNLTLTGSPVYSTDVPFPSPSTRLDIDQSASTTGNTYTTPTAIDEAATARLSFTPEYDPQASIDFYFAAKGTGTVTVTIHDQQNRTIATQSKLTGAMGTGYIEFIFSSNWRPVLGREYHAHVTSTVADTTIRTTTTGDLETASYHTYYSFLVSDTDYHPILPMMNFLAFGNERYLGTWEGILYQPNQITFPSGWRVRCLAYWREYLAIGLWKGTSITDYDSGRIYFWDGISDTFNFFIDVPEGGINSMLGSRGELHIFAGYQGDHLVYTGGDKAVKVKRIPKITKDKYLEIMPGAMTMYKTLLHYGVAGNTDSTAVEKGVYSWGSINQNYPECLSYDYPISTGTRTPITVKIGTVHPIGNKLLIGWQDNTAYGFDVVDPGGSPFTSGTMEFLIKDLDTIWRDQMMSILRGDFIPLTTGESVDIKYKIDRATSWTGLSTIADSSNNTDGTARIQLNNQRNREFQVAFDLFATSTTSPTMLGLSTLMDDLAEEQTF